MIYLPCSKACCCSQGKKKTKASMPSVWAAQPGIGLHSMLRCLFSFHRVCSPLVPSWARGWHAPRINTLPLASASGRPRHPPFYNPLTEAWTGTPGGRDGICHSRHSRRECKIFASGVNFSRNNAVCYINESKKLHFILISSLKLLTYY